MVLTVFVRFPGFWGIFLVSSQVCFFGEPCATSGGWAKGSRSSGVKEKSPRVLLGCP